MEGCGAAGSRTLVQTSSNRAFYMLSSFLIVGNRQATNSQPEAYLLCFRHKPEAPPPCAGTARQSTKLRLGRESVAIIARYGFRNS